jgi:hypothetical protein
MSVFKHGAGTTRVPMHEWVTNVRHAPAPKELSKAPKLEKYKPTYEPKYALPRREWVSGQITASTTNATRREWFRLMSWNVMTDSFTAQRAPSGRIARTVEESEAIRSGKLRIPEGKPLRATPIAAVKAQVPPDLLSWDHRSCKIVDEIMYHDPDIMILNEVNRSHFNQSLWKMLRSQGYGALYLSSRLDKTQTSPLDNPAGRDARNPHMGTARYEEDVGNAIFYHKGRFFPFFMPGIETPKQIPYMSVTGLRDRVSNLTAMCVAVQFTAGDGPEAVAAREWEARCTLRVVDTINRNSTDRGFTGTIIAGDFNNSDYDEPCVSMMQERFASAYDLVGGARWTTWYKTDIEKPWPEQRHMHPEWKKRNFEGELMETKLVSDSIRGVMKDRADKRRLAEGKVRKLHSSLGDTPGVEPLPDVSMASLADALEGKPPQPRISDPAASGATAGVSGSSQAESTAAPIEPESHAATHTAASEEATQAKENADETNDEPIVQTGKFRKPEVVAAELATVEKARGLEALRTYELAEKERALALRKKGIVKRASDFIFFDDALLTTLRVLDTPADTEVNPDELLPNDEIPSHHVPLVVDMCWNTFAPAAPSREKGEKY